MLDHYWHGSYRVSGKNPSQRLSLYKVRTWYGMTGSSLLSRECRVSMGAGAPEREEPPPAGSFACRSTIIQRLAQTKPAIGKGGPVPRWRMGSRIFRDHGANGFAKTSAWCHGRTDSFRPKPRPSTTGLARSGKMTGARLPAAGGAAADNDSLPVPISTGARLDVIIYEGGSQTFRQISWTARSTRIRRGSVECESVGALGRRHARGGDGWL